MKRVYNGKRISKRVYKFIKFVKSHLSEWGVAIVWGRGNSVQCNGCTAAGFFSDEELVMKIATKNEFWLDTLIHEYAHFLQWIEGNTLFKKSARAIENVEDWFNREEVGARRLSRSFSIIRAMERDCEMKACKIAKKFKLPIDPRGYARRANLYIYTHWIMEQERRFWAYKKNPLHSKYILSLMPNNFKKHTHKRIPPKILKALNSYV